MESTAWVRSIPNTCGEIEREAKSRKYNVIEAFFMMTFVLAVLWLWMYPFGTLMHIKAVDKFGNNILFLGAMYLLFVSPFLHRDTADAWGVGNPMDVYRRLTRGPVGARLRFACILVAVIAGLATAYYVNWPEAAKFLLGMKPETAARIKETGGGKIIVGYSGVMLAAFFATCAIRYDNFLSALFTAFKILLLLASMLYLAAFATMGTKAFADFNGSKFALDVFGYVFWGAIQQLLFCSYFGTRIRKGFAPAQDPAQINKRRIKVAILNGFFFGLIHINSWYLVIATWLLGCFLSYVFMERKNRNLIALGFVHGFLGSSMGWLFSRGKGQIQVSMGVGPSHMHGFDLPTVLVVVTLIAAFVAFMIYAYRSWREE